MGIIQLVVLVAVALIALAHVLSRLALRRACRNGAAKIHQELTRMFDGEHEFRVVLQEEARQIEASEEEELRAALRTAGFHPLGWIEDLTASAVLPHLRAIIECHAAADGRTCATILRTAGLRMFDLGTRLPGERFLVTTNAEVNKLQPPSSTEKETLPYATPFEALHARHLERLAERGLDAAQVVPCRSLDDVIVASRLYSRQASAHRSSIGYLSREELMRMGQGVQQEAVVQRVWEEFQRLQESGRRAA